MRAALTVIVVLTSTFALACGGDDGGATDTDGGGRTDGGTTDCEGCLDEFGDCRSGQSASACGSGGEECVACGAGEECAEGACMRPPACSRATCDGCCDGDECVAGSSLRACGTGGVECATCSEGASCTAGRCVAPCAESCDGCCAPDGTCVAAASTSAMLCGSGGSMCTACGGGQSCVDGVCVAASCAMTCAGCCMGGTCVDPPSDAACGIDGAACQDCGAGTCAMGTCAIGPGSRWDVVAVQGTVPERNASGSAWDPFGGMPDPFLVAIVGEGAAQVRGETANQSNTIEPVWLETVLSDVPASDLLAGLTVELRDADPDADDSIGTCVITLDATYFPSTFDATCPADAAAGRAGWDVRMRIEAHAP